MSIGGHIVCHQESEVPLSSESLLNQWVARGSCGLPTSESPDWPSVARWQRNHYYEKFWIIEKVQLVQILTMLTDAHDESIFGAAAGGVENSGEKAAVTES